MPPNPSAVQTMITRPKTEFNTWLKSFAPGFSVWFSYEEDLREHTLDFFQHFLSEYLCVQTETRGQQLKKASLPQQTLPGGVILSASVRGAVTSSLLTWDEMLMAEGFCVPAGPISPSHSGLPWLLCWQYFGKKEDLEICNRKLFLLKHPVFRMEALFNTDLMHWSPPTDCQERSAHYSWRERKQLEWEGWKETLQAYPWRSIADPWVLSHFRINKTFV